MKRRGWWEDQLLGIIKNLGLHTNIYWGSIYVIFMANAGGIGGIGGNS